MVKKYALSLGVTVLVILLLVGTGTYFLGQGWMLPIYTALGLSVGYVLMLIRLHMYEKMALTNNGQQRKKLYYIDMSIHAIPEIIIIALGAIIGYRINQSLVMWAILILFVCFFIPQLCYTVIRNIKAVKNKKQ